RDGDLRLCALRLRRRREAVAAFVVVRAGHRRRQMIRPDRRQLARIHAAARVAAASPYEVALAAARTGRVLILIEGRDFMRRVDARGHLGELLVALAVVVERFEVRLDARIPRVEIEVQRQPADAETEIGIAIRAERPDLVSDDRTAE